MRRRPIEHVKRRIDPISRSEKNRIVASIRANFHVWHERHIEHIPITRACFWWAIFTASSLKTILQARTLVSAGSFMYPRLRLIKHGDKTENTHFSYVFDPNSAKTQEMLSQGVLPEMHVWVTIPEREEIVDLTTCYLRQQCEEIGGMAWDNDDPPDYIWCDRYHIPKGVYYLPHPTAVDITKDMSAAIFRS